MKLSSTSLLGIAFALLFALPVKATVPPEGQPLVIESAWVVADHQYLINLLSNWYGIDGSDLQFPEEICSNSNWFGAALTDGNEMYTVIMLPLKKGNTNTRQNQFLGFRISDISDFTLRIRLQTNPIIAELFPNGAFQICEAEAGSYLKLTSRNLTWTDELRRLLVNHHWRPTRERWHFAFVAYYPERTLLPVLPPEQEDESTFIKMVRERSDNNYQDGQFVGTVFSEVWGLYHGDHDVRFVLEVINAEDAPVASDVEQVPFQFGGFVNPETPMGAAFRLGREFVETQQIGIRIGFGAIPPAERTNDERKHQFFASLFVQRNRMGDRDGLHLINDGNIYIYYPKQLENRPEEEGVLSESELENINVKMANTLLNFGSIIRQSLLSQDWTQPIDIALSFEDEAIYLACTYPHSEFKIDWVHVVQFSASLSDYFRQMDTELSDMEELRMEIIGEPKVDGEITWHLMLLHWDVTISLIVGYAPDRVYVAILLDEVSEEWIDEQFDTVQQRLVQKVSVSKQGIADKIKPPRTLFHVNYEGSTMRLDYESDEHGFRFSFHVSEDSLETALALLASYGSNLMPELPFMRMLE